MAPEGLHYVPDVVTPIQEAALLVQFAGLSPQPIAIRGRLTRRRVHPFGWAYHPTNKQVTQVAPMPDSLVALCHTCCECCAMDNAFQQATVTQYPPGAGIGAHIDAPLYGDTILVLSLAIPAHMRFRLRQSGVHLDLVLAPRSLLLLRGPSRWEWSHEIVATSVKQTRWSVTFRSVQS